MTAESRRRSQDWHKSWHEHSPTTPTAPQTRGTRLLRDRDANHELTCAPIPTLEPSMAPVSGFRPTRNPAESDRIRLSRDRIGTGLARASVSHSQGTS